MARPVEVSLNHFPQRGSGRDRNALAMPTERVGVNSLPEALDRFARLGDCPGRFLVHRVKLILTWRYWACQ